MQYVVVIEKAANNYCAYVPDLPGCIATGSTRDETLAEIRSAIEFHIEGIVEDGEPIPETTTAAAVVEISIPMAAAVES